MQDGERRHIGRTAMLLGFAGLLPQVAAVGVLAAVVLARADPGPAVVAAMVACVYAAAILSFLGGIWWGFAMRAGAAQGALVALAVLPSLLVVGLLLWALVGARPVWPMIFLGSAILLTLPVDRQLAAHRLAPAGWMRLRVPLSLGLGGLTIVAGLLVSG